MRRTAAAACIAAMALAGCGGDAELTVSAAASLKEAFTAYEPDGRYAFAGSDELAAQLRAGARPDVYAAANAQLPRELHRDGLAERPVVFASNRLVIAVRREANAVLSVDDLGKRGVTVAVGTAAVPVGRYTRELLARLDAGQAERILANVRSTEPDATGVVGSVTQGAVDAGIVYATDVRATRGRLRAIALPDHLQPSVAYAAVAIKGGDRPREARAFVTGLTGERGQKALRRAGFEPPP